MRPSDRERDQQIAERINAELDRRVAETMGWLGTAEGKAEIREVYEECSRAVRIERLEAGQPPNPSDEHAVRASLARIEAGDDTGEDRRLRDAYVKGSLDRKPGKRGPKEKYNIEKDEVLWLAAQIARRVKELGRKQPGLKVSHGAAIKISCERVLSSFNKERAASESELLGLIDAVHSTMRQSGRKNFSNHF